jgi:drug/metabolite transporter (DMT)-like permease
MRDFRPAQWTFLVLGLFGLVALALTFGTTSYWANAMTALITCACFGLASPLLRRRMSRRALVVDSASAGG